MMGDIIFFDVKLDIVKALRERGIDAKQTIDPFHDLEFDWIVSPANCYGHMDGGFDLYLAKNLRVSPLTGWREYLDDERPVDMSKPFLKPGQVVEWPEMSVLIATTVRSRTAQTSRPARREYIESCLEQLFEFAEETGQIIACPGLGTGFGGLTPEEFADCVAEAIPDDDLSDNGTGSVVDAWVGGNRLYYTIEWPNGLRTTGVLEEKTMAGSLSDESLEGLAESIIGMVAEPLDEDTEEQIKKGHLDDHSIGFND